MEQNFLCRYYINILVSVYLSFNLQERLAIDKAGSQLMRQKRCRRVFIYYSNQDTSNITNLSNMNVNLSLSSQTKCDNMFSDPESDQIFSHFSGTYLVYILFLLVCDNYPLTSKRGRCRNILSIDSRLNRIGPSTNICLPNPERGYRTKFEILLEVVFQYSIE